MPEELPEQGIELHGVLHTITASELRVGDVVFNGYVRKVADEPRIYMGYIQFTAAQPIVDDGYTMWRRVGRHCHKPDHQVLVLRVEPVCEPAMLEQLAGSLWLT